MKSNFVLISLIALLAVVALASSVSASTLDILGVSVWANGLNAGAGDVAVEADTKVPISISFQALEDASDVQVSAWFLGERSDAVEKDFSDLIAWNVYKVKGLSVLVPADIEPEEELTLYVRIESDAGNWEESYTLQGQRQPDNLDVLLVDFDNSVNAGTTLAVDVVVRNLGRQDAENTFVTVEIPELGVSKTVYLEDLYPTDDCDDDCEKEDTKEGKLFVTIPSDAEAGVYEVQVTAKTEDTKTTVTKNLVVKTAEAEASVVSNPVSKTFSVGETVTYDLILVNTGSEIALYNIAPTSASDALTISLSDSVVAVPAGSSKTVKVSVKANREGTYGFEIGVTSDGLSQTARYTATVEGRSLENNVVVLTIVLAIIFVILVIILIVLLTRKSEKSEEFTESYY